MAGLGPGATSWLARTDIGMAAALQRPALSEKDKIWPWLMDAPELFP